MSRTSPPGLFITGTSTGVGKTFVGAGIARALVADGTRVGVYKPAASGCHWRSVTDEQGELRSEIYSDDAGTLWEAAGQPGTLTEVCPQRYLAPLAPHLAAEVEQRALDPKLLREGLEPWRRRSEVILVEGAGGLLSPLGPREYVADLAADFGFPLVLVAPNEVGVINQVLQTLFVADSMAGGLAVAAIVLNHRRHQSLDDDPSVLSNRRELEARCPGVPIVELSWNSAVWSRRLDWLGLARQGLATRESLSRIVAAIHARE